MNQIEQVTTWIDAAKQEPNVRNTMNYVAFVLSEVGEMLNTVGIYDLSAQLEGLSDDMRQGNYDELMRFVNSKSLMDDAADVVWTAIGLMHMLGDAQGAFAEVAASNHSKFENGVCALDETGKVIKGPGYFKPELSKFLREVGHE